jgi:hypothetical protein
MLKSSICTCTSSNRPKPSLQIVGKYTENIMKDMVPTPNSQPSNPNSNKDFVGLAYQGKDIVFARILCLGSL